MNNALLHPLQCLYGLTTAADVAAQLAVLLERWHLRLPPAGPSRRDLPVSQHDALLITYADQLSRPGQSPLAVLAEFSAHHLKGVVSGIHLLPFYPWSSDDGFSVKDFRAIAPGNGTWEDIACLRSDFELMFDAVFNHVSVQGAWFQGFLAGDPRHRDFFITVPGDPDLSQVVRPRALPLLTEFPTAAGPKRVWTTFSADQADLNFHQPAVLLAVLEALLFYVSQGARFIRLDAVAFLWKEIGTNCLHRPQTHLLIQWLRAVLDELAPQVLLITETNVPHRDNLSYFGDGTNEAQLVYNFALPPLVLHSLQSGNAEKLTRWAKSLGTLPTSVTFFNFLASHDGIGLNPVRGILTEAEIGALVNRTLEHGGFISYKHQPDGSQVPYEMNISYLDALSHPTAGEPPEQAARKFLTAHAILLSLQGVPGIYFHSLFGSRGDRAGALASGISRRINREKLALTRLEAELTDLGSLRDHVWKGMHHLLQIRRAYSAFSPRAAQVVLADDPRLFAVWRLPADGQERILCLHNVSAQSVQATGPILEAMASTTSLDVLTGQWHGPASSGGSPVTLAAYQTLWLWQATSGASKKLD
jgi:sucrose phosphorylase